MNLVIDRIMFHVSSYDIDLFYRYIRLIPLEFEITDFNGPCDFRPCIIIKTHPGSRSSSSKNMFNTTPRQK